MRCRTDSPRSCCGNSAWRRSAHNSSCGRRLACCSEHCHSVPQNTGRNPRKDGRQTQAPNPQERAMTARLTLICHGSTDAVRAAAFPKDEPLDHHGKTGATELVGCLPSVDCCWTSPELRTRQTAEALG